MPISFKNLSLFLLLAVKVSFVLTFVHLRFRTYIHTESHKDGDAELIDINLCLNNVDIHT